MTHAAVTTRLRQAGSVFAEAEASLLIAESTDAAGLEDAVRRRTAGEPMEYILGWAEFCGLRIELEPGVFVPRQRTRLLVEQAARFARSGAALVDLCCGSGAVSAAVLAIVPGVEVHATDIDPAAVACARRNLGTNARVYEGDLYAALPTSLTGCVAVIVANAPYVPTEAIAMMPLEARLHESRIALDGGADGLDLHRRIAAGASRWLASSGHVLVETSSGQAVHTAAAFESAGLAARIIRSTRLDATVVMGSAPLQSPREPKTALSRAPST